MRTLPLLLLLASLGCHKAERYEFHTGPQGLILYRCDRQTGETWYSVPANHTGWIAVADPNHPTP